MSKHVPTPWAIEYQLPTPNRLEMLVIVQSNVIPAYPDTIVEIVWETGLRPEDRPNAEFIVRACNSHEKLVAALNLSLASIESVLADDDIQAYGLFKGPMLPNAIKAIDEALAIAKQSTQ